MSKSNIAVKSRIIRMMRDNAIKIVSDKATPAMKITSLRTISIAALALAVFISGCTTGGVPNHPVTQAAKPVAPPKPAPQVKKPETEPTEQLSAKAARAAAQAELDSGIALYNSGDYREAIKRLATVSDDLKPYKDMELLALKYSAFSYCVTGHAPMCKQQFEKAVKLDPSFDLEPGEKGHPLWGPVFDRVKKEAH